ncbi:hypothetical protein MLD38_031028 [Melastoma candidum]|uniref:Uncharacterized protein n=1 Tax=Melastoma candidum TaxID=119954 RepID=A0ACB9MMV8_9MYRT|nr:hypothetical protein MLD38_031028 [Melastoma candidum]
MTSFDHGSMAFIPYGEYWKKIRKICMMELLSPSCIRRFRSLKEQEISNLVEAVKCTSGVPFNISEMVSASSNSVLAKATFGEKCKRQDEFISTVEEQLRLAGELSLPEVFPYLQFLHRLNGKKAKMSRHARWRNRYFTSAVEWALSEMLKNPEVMKKAQTELRDALKGKVVLEEADLEKIQYSKLIFKETFRLHPPAAIIPLINTWSLGRDPNRWQNPEKFKPERFLSSSTDYVWSHLDFLPFGSGRRACPGAGFALASIESILANLIYYFDWKLANGMVPDELDMAEASGVVIKRWNPLFVIATPHFYAA